MEKKITRNVSRKKKAVKAAPRAKVGKTTKKKSPVSARPRKASAARGARGVRSRRTGSSALGITALWISMGGSIFALATGLWYMQKPLTTPAPADIVVTAATPVVEVPASVVKPERIPHPFDKDFQDVWKLPIGERVAFWSAYIRKQADVREHFKALGEPPVIEDTAPVLAEKFDCTTFVETVASLARSQLPEEFYGNLLAIRYRGGRATFQERNHFPEADWIPNNEKAGILKDITATVAERSGVKARFESKLIDRGKWLAKQVEGRRVSRALASVVQAAFEKPVEAKVPYIPLSDLDNVADRIPEGAILNFVRNNSARDSVLIKHQGFIVRDHGTPMLRHVSYGGKLRTVRLKEYIRREGRNFIGINLNQLTGHER